MSAWTRGHIVIGGWPFGTQAILLWKRSSPCVDCGVSPGSPSWGRYFNKIENVICSKITLPTCPTMFHKIWLSRTSESHRSSHKRIHCQKPVPRVLEVFKDNVTVFIVQEFIDGRQPLLFRVWRSIRLDDRKWCMLQLKKYIEQLRRLILPNQKRCNRYRRQS